MNGTDPSVTGERVKRGSGNERRAVSSEWVGGRTPSTREEAWAGSVVKWKPLLRGRVAKGDKRREEVGEDEDEEHVLVRRNRSSKIIGTFPRKHPSLQRTWPFELGRLSYQPQPSAL